MTTTITPGVFGVWNAIITDRMQRIPPPVGEPCMYCETPIQEGDHGAVAAGVGVMHKECHYREVAGGIGHHVNHARYCQDAWSRGVSFDQCAGGDTDSDAGLPARLSALLAWRHVTHGPPVTERDLELTRAREAGS